ncbi:MAG: hypothetical protein IJV04_07540 [Lachnospiraceae bacterium]|nr:hypothetical protein [Lachnospiraceae bacterium]
MALKTIDLLIQMDLNDKQVIVDMASYLKSASKVILICFAIIMMIIIVFCFHEYHAMRKAGALGTAIIQHIDSTIEADEDGECIIDLNEITDFEWDTVFVISPGYTINSKDPKQKIIQLVGCDLEFPKEYDKYRAILIFLKDDDVVYTES